MPLSIDQMLATSTPADFIAKIKGIATTVGLAPASWPTLGITNTIIASVANLLGVPAGAALDTALAAKGLDGLASVIAASGFLDTAAAVTPDPPVQAADGSFPGWLDLLADSLMDVRRVGAVRATGPVTLTNAGALTRGPFAPGAYHIANTALKTTYSNTTTFSIAGAADTTTTFAADTPGSSATTVASALTPVTSFVGVTVKTSGGANTNTMTGSDAQTNASLVATCRGKIQSLGPKLGPVGAYQFFATATSLAGYPTLAAPITRIATAADPLTGALSVYVAGAVGPTSAPDVALLSTYLQAAVVPDGFTVSVVAASAVNVNIAITVYVPAANAGTAVAQVRTAITDYVNSLPIGGSPGPASGLQFADIIAALFAKVSYVKNVTSLTINSVVGDQALTASQCAVVLPAPTVTVVTF